MLLCESFVHRQILCNFEVNTNQLEHILFLSQISEVPKLTTRLEHIKFMRQFDELVGDIKPNIASASAAIQDLLKSER